MYARSWRLTRANSVGFLCKLCYSKTGIILLRELPQNDSVHCLLSWCGNWQHPTSAGVPLGRSLVCSSVGPTRAKGDTMTSHADIVSRTTRHQGGSEPGSGVGVASSDHASEPGFLALPPALYRWTYLELGALATAPACARLHTKQLLWEWGLSGLIDSSVAVVSELVTNAIETTVRHQLGTPIGIALRLSSNGHQALIEVWDADPAPPQAPALDADCFPLADAENGRGLFLVASLSNRWTDGVTTSRRPEAARSCGPTSKRCAHPVTWFLVSLLILSGCGQDRKDRRADAAFTAERPLR